MKAIVVILAAIAGLLFLDRNAAIRERDEARDIARTAHEKIARLTQTTPAPENWLTNRLEKSTGRLDSPAVPAPYPRNPYDRSVPPSTYYPR